VPLEPQDKITEKDQQSSHKAKGVMVWRGPRGPTGAVWKE